MGEENVAPYQVQMMRSTFRQKNILGREMDRLLDLSLRKLIFRFQRDILRKRMPVVASASVVELLGQEQYRRIAGLDRREAGELVVQHIKVRFTDNAALFGMLDEIFVRENYKFECSSPCPTIIDCGANVGLSVLYFKSLYPDAVIHAFEPDPEAFEMLVENMSGNGLEDVHTYNAAVWVHEGELAFERDGSWGGHIAANTGPQDLKVKAHTLDGLLREKVEFLKIDIEGAESEVIMHARELIARNVERMFFEWHSLAGEPQRLGELLAYFERNGFRHHIKEASNKQTPFIPKPCGRMDSQLDVFLWKPQA